MATAERIAPMGAVELAELRRAHRPFVVTPLGGEAATYCRACTDRDAWPCGPARLLETLVEERAARLMAEEAARSDSPSGYVLWDFADETSMDEYREMARRALLGRSGE